MSYMSEESIKEQNNIELNIKDLEVIFDVLNVYDPNDIKDVYPEMGTKEFVQDVNSTWKKVLEIIAGRDQAKLNHYLRL
jgi:uncharacterized protein YjgD (DUF1641 family)